MNSGKSKLYEELTDFLKDYEIVVMEETTNACNMPGCMATEEII